MLRAVQGAEGARRPLHAWLQARRISSTRPLSKPHSGILDAGHHMGNHVKVLEHAGRRQLAAKYLYWANPLKGTPGLHRNEDIDHPWDFWGNPHRIPIFSFGRGMAARRHYPWYRRNGMFMDTRWGIVASAPREHLLRPQWCGSTRFRIPPHMAIPPGHRPGCDWPTAWSKEYGGWFEIPHMKGSSRTYQTDDMPLRFAAERAQKMEALRFTLAAANWQAGQKARWEAGGGPRSMLQKQEHASGGTLGTAPPSPSAALQGLRRKGEIWTGQVGPGSFPMPGSRTRASG
eukprot:TRINITY_DN36318_c0_g1_i1.p1 TRINITY_DN36318_c0_g1~~TRINITY_DN36318_c0_g1_i1.p1  ORF type:complete len:288 (+),score=45.25 TRINITY_DN36318_c0_g1_i1:66-929(+)